MLASINRREFLAQAMAVSAASLLLPRPGLGATAARWTPPPLSNPIEVEVVDGKNAYGTYPTDRDVLVILPKKVRTAQVGIHGGRNVRVIGGHIAPRNISGTKYALRVGSVTGSVFIEGVYIDASAEPMDGIATWGKSGYRPNIYIQNCRIMNITGTYGGTHGDIVQIQYPVGAVRIDGLTGSTGYQGLFLPNSYVGSAELSRVNIYGLDNPDTSWTPQIWLGGCSNPYPATLTDVWCKPRTGHHVGQCVYPRPGSVSGCSAIVSADRESVSWPSERNIKGIVRSGVPSTGDFCPNGAAGYNYVGSGYNGGASTSGSTTPTATPTGSTGCS